MKDYWLGLIRHALTLGAGYFIASGKLDPESAQTILGTLAGLAGTIWSLTDKRKKKAAK
jgi:hypothetical protein